MLLKRSKNVLKVTHVPFYGGAKGQTLEITQTVDGNVYTKIIEKIIKSEQEPSPIDVEYPPLPSKYGEYDKHLKDIHQTALKIVKLQEQVKRDGQLSEEEKAQYEKDLDSLNLSAKNLVNLYDNEDEDDTVEARETGLSSWFNRQNNKKKNKTSNKKDEDKVKEEEKKKTEAKKKEEEEKKREEDRKKEEQKRKEEAKRKEDEKRKEEAKRKEEDRQKEEQKNKEEMRKKEQLSKKEPPKHGQEEVTEESNQEQESESDDNETVAINLPPPDASVAEAKPVGLAIAGIGGVAASKPIATAVVGPGGLAIARPIGTAIAGVSPDQAMIPIYPEGYLKPPKGNKKDNSSKNDYVNKLIEKYHKV